MHRKFDHAAWRESRRETWMDQTMRRSQCVRSARLCVSQWSDVPAATVWCKVIARFSYGKSRAHFWGLNKRTNLYNDRLARYDHLQDRAYAQSLGSTLLLTNNPVVPLSDVACMSHGAALRALMAPIRSHRVAFPPPPPRRARVPRSPLRGESHPTVKQCTANNRPGRGRHFERDGGGRDRMRSSQAASLRKLPPSLSLAAIEAVQK